MNIYNFNLSRPKVNHGCYEWACIIVRKICSNSLQESCRGDILVFLPGYNEILILIETITNLTSQDWISQNLKIIELHSTLGNLNAGQVLNANFSSRRNLILATNIAESSITIPECIYVIDFCLIKEMRFHINS